ncbi:MAG: maleylpyruvate isomerase family mycothiol-dependent enzyme [Actinomycetota bacterium]|nr:maleylpyruvate isomerase family mycothiol-dependent enzyme [Actinomycetota bacterium]
MSPAIVEALRAEAAHAGAFLGSLSEEDLDRKTRCPPLTIRELAVHTLRGSMRIREMIEAGPVDAQPESDGETYFRYDPAEVGPDVIRRAQEAAEDLGPGIKDLWLPTWSASLDAAAAVLTDGDPVLRNVFGGLMKLSEYLRTRAVEVVIHHMDLRDARGLAPDPDEDALEIVCRVLAGLLGTDPRRLGMEAIRFALLGTGRTTLTDAERKTLGPLADEMPVLT